MGVIDPANANRGEYLNLYSTLVVQTGNLARRAPRPLARKRIAGIVNLIWGSAQANQPPMKWRLISLRRNLVYSMHQVYKCKELLK